VEACDRARRLSEHGDSGMATGGAAPFASSTAIIFSTIDRTSLNRANAPSMQVLMSMDEHIVATSVGGAHRDGDNESSDDVLESTTDHENNATTGLGCDTGINGDDDTGWSTTDVSPTDEYSVVRDHTMFAPVGGACGDGSGKSRYGIPRSIAKREGYATTGIGGATHGMVTKKPTMAQPD
jgi:hypothetical protein